MDLDEIKNNWKKIEDLSAGNSSLSQEQLEKITHKKYSNNLLKIAFPEFFFGLMYLFLLLFFISFNNLFEGGFQIALSYLAIVLLVVLPFISLSNTYQFYMAGKLQDSYNETLELFKKQSSRFRKLKSLVLALNIILLLICVLLIPKVYSEHLSNTSSAVVFGIGLLLFLWISSRIWKYYLRKIKMNEELVALLG